jgi:superfamily II DNA/RNA helicase
MGQAQTGTGKTAAFVLPILQHLMDGPKKRIRALIIAPTRELAEQTHDAIGHLGRYTKLKSVTIYGGVNQNLQMSRLRGGADIVVACPGRLIDLMDKRLIDLSRIEVLVLDEADRMFDMGFLPDVRNILKRLPVQRQTLLFAATMPDDVRELAESVLRNPVTVQVGEAVPVSTVSHAIYPVDPHLKTPLLMKILGCTDTASVLVFTRTKDRASVAAVKGALVRFGADPDILVDSRPHVGSNRLPRVLLALRAHIEAAGCEYRFTEAVADLEVEAGRVVGVRLASGVVVGGDAVVLACGHSARPHPGVSVL